MQYFIDPIGLVSFYSFLIALVAGLYLLYTYYETKKKQRLVWGLGMVFYAIGHLIISIIFLFSIAAINFEVAKFWVWIYINLSGGVAMGCMLVGVLPIFFKEKNVYSFGVSMAYTIGYFLGTTLYGFILPGDTPLNFINLKYLFLAARYTNPSLFQYDNMSWFAVEWLIPASFIIGLLFFQHYKKKEANPSLFIAIHFIGYALLLFIWPFEELKLVFYETRAFLSFILLYGFSLLSRKQ